MELFELLGLDYFLSHVGDVFNYDLFKNCLSAFLFLFFLWDTYNSYVAALLQGTLLQGIFPEPGIEPMSPVAPALQVDSLAPEALISYTPIRSDQSLNRVRLFATP